MLKSYLQAFFESHKLSFCVGYSHLKYGCEQLGYNISNFYNDLRHILNAMYSNNQIQYFEVQPNGWITVIR